MGLHTRLSDFISLHFFTSLKLKGHLSGPEKLSVGLESPEHHGNEKWAFREFVLTRNLWMKHRDLAGPEYWTKCWLGGILSLFLPFWLVYCLSPLLSITSVSCDVRIFGKYYPFLLSQSPFITGSSGEVKQRPVFGAEPSRETLGQMMTVVWNWSPFCSLWCQDYRP